MAEQSHREEMSAAIRAQRERQAAARGLAEPAESAPEPAAEAPPGAEPMPDQALRKGRFSRFFGG